MTETEEWDEAQKLIRDIEEDAKKGQKGFYSLGNGMEGCPNARIALAAHAKVQ